MDFSSFPQPVCYPCEVSQGGSVIASPPVGCLVFVQHSKYMCLKSALMLIRMLQNVFCNIGRNIGCRWLRAARAHHRGLAWFVPSIPWSTWDTGHCQQLHLPGAGSHLQEQTLKQPEMFSPTRKPNLICAVVARSLTVNEGSLCCCRLVSVLFGFPGFPKGLASGERSNRSALLRAQATRLLRPCCLGLLLPPPRGETASGKLPFSETWTGWKVGQRGT